MPTIVFDSLVFSFLFLYCSFQLHSILSPNEAMRMDPSYSIVLFWDKFHVLKKFNKTNNIKIKCTEYQIISIIVTCTLLKLQAIFGSIFIDSGYAKLGFVYHSFVVDTFDKHPLATVLVHFNCVQ